MYKQINYYHEIILLYIYSSLSLEYLFLWLLLLLEALCLYFSFIMVRLRSSICCWRSSICLNKHVLRLWKHLILWIIENISCNIFPYLKYSLISLHLGTLQLSSLQLRACNCNKLLIRIHNLHPFATFAVHIKSCRKKS